MRSALALGLLMALSASADASTVHHARIRYHHHVFLPRGVTSSFAAVPNWTYRPPRPSLHYDDTPSYDDPSKLGSY